MGLHASATCAGLPAQGFVIECLLYALVHSFSGLCICVPFSVVVLINFIKV